MRFQRYVLNERYYKRFIERGDSFELFKNPSLKEIRDLIHSNKDKHYANENEVRFMADNNNKTTWVWIWDAVNHDNMIERHLKKEVGGRNYNDPTLFLGISDIRGKVIDNDTLRYNSSMKKNDYINTLLNIDWNWAKPFKISEYLKRKEYE